MFTGNAELQSTNEHLSLLFLVHFFNCDEHDIISLSQRMASSPVLPAEDQQVSLGIDDLHFSLQGN